MELVNKEVRKPGTKCPVCSSTKIISYKPVKDKEDKVLYWYAYCQNCKVHGKLTSRRED